MKKRNAPGELELIILQKLQLCKQATVSELEKELNNTYAYTTILTVLSRMHSKKLVKRIKIGRQFVYSAQKEQNLSILNRIKQKLFGGQTSGMIQYLINSSDKISKKELEEIEKIIKRYKHES
ncbi:MAG: hypothetical protein S4CHLAM7_12840 [Chlamydiae bacterium]|nr:hypothetical protein [Chlamydiota bacterium]